MNIDFKSSLECILKSLLGIVKRPAGAILIPSSQYLDTVILASKNFPEKWLADFDSPDNPLRQTVNQVLITGCNFPNHDISRSVEIPPDLACITTLKIHTETIALLIIQGQVFTPREAQVITDLLPIISQNIQIYRATLISQEQIKKITDLHLELSQTKSHLNFESTQKLLIESVAQILDCKACALVLLDENHKEWMIRKSLSAEADLLFQINPREGNGLVKECLRNGKTICSNNLDNDTRFDRYSDSISEKKTHSLLCAPIIIDHTIIGGIQAVNKNMGKFNKLDQHLLSLTTALVAKLFKENRLLQDLVHVKSKFESSLLEQEYTNQTLQALFDNLPLSIYIINHDFKLAAINKSCYAQLGHVHQAFIGQRCYTALFERDKPCPNCRVMETLNKGIETQRNERRFSNPDHMDAKDYYSEWIISSYPILSKDNHVIQAILIEEDITQRKKLEAALTQSDKLAAIGQIAAGIAHEINNPLTAIIANAQILHRELPYDKNLQESVDLIARAGARAAQVVQNLLDFARKDDYNLEITSVNETLEKALALVQHELMARAITLEFFPDPDLPTTYASQDHLQSVWLNLLLNAIDAFDKEPGKVKITTDYTTTDSTDDCLSKEIRVSIADNGKGISPENLARVFEPFYTTKAPGRGTGLGLSVSYRIIKQHGGSIQVQSQVGVGSNFSVTLPIRSPEDHKLYPSAC